MEWKDIDWEGGVINVRRTSNYTAEKGTYTDTTKTKKSQRSLKFPPVVMDLLKAFKAEQDEERKKLGSKWVDTDRLFVKWNGEPQHPNTTYTWFLRFCERNNFRFCDIHSMRHRNNMKTPLSQAALLKQTSPCKPVAKLYALLRVLILWRIAKVSLFKLPFYKVIFTVLYIN